MREYERSLRLHVLPMLGGVRLSRSQRRDVQVLVDGMLSAGADPSTIRNALKPMRVIYRLAIEDGDLAVSPCERLRLPAVRGRRERIASPEEAAALIDALREDDRALWGGAFYAGLRRGELRALLWQDVDLAAGLIRVERSMSGKGEIGEPKSRAGRATSPSSPRSVTSWLSTSSSHGESRASSSARARRPRSRRTSLADEPSRPGGARAWRRSDCTNAATPSPASSSRPA